MPLYLYGNGEGLIQHFLIKSFKRLQIVVSHRNICFGKLPLYTKYLYRATDSKSFPEKALLLVLIKKAKVNLSHKILECISPLTHLMFTENRKMKFLHKNKPGSNLFPNHFPVWYLCYIWNCIVVLPKCKFNQIKQFFAYWQLAADYSLCKVRIEYARNLFMFITFFHSLFFLTSTSLKNHFFQEYQSSTFFNAYKCTSQPCFRDYVYIRSSLFSSKVLLISTIFFLNESKFLFSSIPISFKI